MYAVVESGGKQHKVAVGDRLRVEKLPVHVGDKIALDRVLFVGGDKGVQVGTPYLNGAKIEVEVLAQGKDKKIIVLKKKKRKGYRKKQGHRQLFTELKVTKITV